MKKILLYSLLVLGIFSCTKSSIETSSDQNVSKIPTIGFGNGSGVSSRESGESVAECGTCPGQIKIGFPVVIENGPEICFRTNSNICWFGGPVSRTTNFEGFTASFQNANGKLQMTVFKSSLSQEHRDQYFSANKFTIEKPEYMSEQVIKELGLSIPYLLKVGSYEIKNENDETFTIIF